MARLRPGALVGLAVGAAAILCGAQGTQDAVANGDTRTVTIQHEHTKETASITFKRNGYYDQSALNQLNWLLRDWRLDEPTRMEPKLFDIVWEVYREVGSQEPIHVVSAYRSPKTNAMLRRRSRAVAEHSQHMAGRAMDFYLPDVPMSRVREIGMRLQNGGVGFYPNAYNPFVHLDAGSVRSWPRMSSDQLARLFPDGRTVHLPRDGRPLAGYEVAKADILARGGAVAGLTYAEGGEGGGERKSLWATLFGSSEDEDSDFYRSPASRTRAAPAARSRVAYADVRTGGNNDDGGTRGFATPMTAPVPDAVATPRLRRGAEPQVQVPATDETAPSAPAAVTAAPPLPPGAPADARPAIAEPVVVATLPSPPRRPGELGILIADAPLPPARPVTMAALAGTPLVGAELNGQMRPAPRQASPAANDERAALKALFDAATTQPVSSRLQFSAAGLDDVRADRFRGPAVVRLPTIR